MGDCPGVQRAAGARSRAAAPAGAQRAPGAQRARPETPSGGAGLGRWGEQETPPTAPGLQAPSAGAPGALGAALWALWWCGDRKFGGFEALALVGFANAPPGTMCFGWCASVGGGRNADESQILSKGRERTGGNPWR